jgi:hypothetical protein
LLDNLSIIKDLGSVVVAAAEALGKLADSIAHMISLGDKGYSIINARRVRNKLKDIDVRLNMMARTRQSIAVLGIRDYIVLCRRIREGRYSKEQISQRLSKNWKDSCLSG